MGWGALKNGALLREAENEGFAVILTADKNIRTQQRMEDRSIALIVLRARNNTLETHVSMLTEVEKVLRTIVPGQVVEVWHQSIKP